jgi:formate dehydrogenase subunit gamma
VLARIRELEQLLGPLLPILDALQEEFGYVDKAAVPLIANALNLPQAEVDSVITIYLDLRDAPAGHHLLRLCRAEACQSMGSDQTIRHVENRLGIKLGHTTDDGSLTINAIYCLGMCASPPAAMLDGKVYGRVSPQVADFLIDLVQRRP